MHGSNSQKKIWKHTAVRDKSLEDSFMQTTNGGYTSNASFGQKARLSKSVVGFNRTAKGAMTARSNGSQNRKS